MDNYLIKGETLTDIANAIRSKTGGTDDIKAKDMASSIQSITTGTDTSDATAIAEDIMQGKTAYIANGKITGNFTIDSELTEQDDLISQISTLVRKKANPEGGTDTSDANATANDILSGKTAYIKGNKITGNIETKTSSNLTASGATVSVPAGYYASQATKSISSGSAKTPATTITKNPTISVNSSGLVTASVSGTQSVTPTVTAGYVSSGTAGTITVSGSATKQLSTKSATIYTPTTSNQTIASGTYLTGTQTIKGDANLIADNIKSGISIFGVNGTYKGSGSSSGGSIETITITYSKLPDPGSEIYYVDGTMTLQQEALARNASYTIAKGSIFIVTNIMYTDIEGCSTICGNSMYRVFLAVN